MSEPLTIEELRETFVLMHTRRHDSYMTGVPLADIRGQYGDVFDAWLAEHDRQVAERAWDRCVGEMPIDPDWKNFYSDQNPYTKEEQS